jgi:hypothetical protein
MDSLSQIADVVIGVDAHTATHSAAVVDARTGAVLAEVTVEATPDGYAELVRLADRHSGLRAWAIEGTGSPDPRQLRHGHQALPSQPLRRPPAQPRAPYDRAMPDPLGRGHPHLCIKCIKRRTAQGKTPREIKRCLKRHIPANCSASSNTGHPQLDNP